MLFRSLTVEEINQRGEANHEVVVALQSAIDKMVDSRNLQGFKATARRLRKLRKENYRLTVAYIKAHWHDK